MATAWSACAHIKQVSMVSNIKNNYVLYEEDYADEEGMVLNITNFHGPMDLLLKLVNDSKIEIKDIFISEVTDTFLKYLSQIDNLDVDKAAEYMYIAATLMEIKSHRMLPVMPGFDDDNDMSEKIFIRQLEEYKLLKEAAEELKHQENPDRLFKEPDISEEARYSVKDMSLENLLKAFASILNKVEMRALDKNTVREIRKESFSVKDKMIYLTERLKNESTLSFFELFDEYSSVSEIVATFSALLELTKLQLITTRQKEDYSDILIYKNFDSIKENFDIEYNEIS